MLVNKCTLMRYVLRDIQASYSRLKNESVCHDYKLLSDNYKTSNIRTGMQTIIIPAMRNI